MSTLIFDIETIGEDFNNLDEISKESLTRWIKKEARDDSEYQVMLNDIKDGLGFSPLTGEIVAIGIHDYEKQKGAVYFQSGHKEFLPWEEDGCKFEAMTEGAMLSKFWEIAEHYSQFVSYNGRPFDVPFMMVRSARYKIRPCKDLMSNRYLSSQKYDAKHIDLCDQLSFYGTVRQRGSLHMWCRAFGIESPKTHGVTGDDVATLFLDGKYEDIARYNVRDLKATAALYEYWNKYIRF